MDLLELLSQELSEKNLDFDDALRYLYLRCCEIFSFDSRYHMSRYFRYGDILKRNLLEYRPDIRNINQLEMVCKPYSYYVLSCVLKELLGADVEVKHDGEHYYVQVHTDSFLYDLDATICSDFARVKMGLNTYGYHCHMFGNPRYNGYEHCKKIDKFLGYIEDDYTSYLDDIDIDDSNYLNYLKIRKLFYQNDNIRTSYGDAMFFIRYLENMMIDTDKIEEHLLMDSNFHMMRIFRFLENDSFFFFGLERDTSYRFEEISKEKYSSLVKKKFV